MVLILEAGTEMSVNFDDFLAVVLVRYQMRKMN